MPRTIKDRILDLKKAFFAENGRDPEYVEIPFEEEIELSALSGAEIGAELAGAIFTQGVRAALPSLFGMSINWDSHSFRVGEGPTLEHAEGRQLTYEEMLAALPSGEEAAIQTEGRHK